MRAFSYARASVDPKKRGRSTADQDTENRRTIEANGWLHVGSFEDLDRSASRYARRAREDYDDMVARIRAGEADVVVAWEASRFHRDLAAYLRLRDLCAETGVLWCYNGRVYDLRRSDDQFVTGLDALISEKEAAAIRERILRTTRLGVERGHPHGLAGHGFRREYDPGTGHLLRQVPDFLPDKSGKADQVLEMAERIADLESLYSIGVDFDRRGVPVPTTRSRKRGVPPRWYPETIKRIVLNPANIGKRTHYGRIVGDAEWDPILPELLYYTCKAILTDPTRTTRRGQEVQHVLSGAVFCGECAGTLRVRTNGKYKSYMCIDCYKVSMKLGPLEDYVQEGILVLLEDPGWLATLTPADPDAVARQVQGLSARIEETERAIAEAHVEMVARRMTAANFGAAETAWLAAIDADRAAIESLTRRGSGLLASAAGPQAREVWATLSIPQRRQLIREASHVELHRARYRGIPVIEPGRVTFELPVGR